MDGETAKEAAKAVSASAELGTTALKTATSLGNVVKGPVSEIVGALEDGLKVWRLERQLALWDKVKFLMAERNLQAPRDLPASFLLPLVDKAQTQEDEGIQELWARLLTNAADPGSGTEPRVAYVEILSQLTPGDARNLSVLVEAEMRHNGERPAVISTWNLPGSAETFDEAPPFVPDIDEETLISLSNLMRLGLIEFSQAIVNDRPLYQYIMTTPLGRAFYRACDPDPIVGA